ncbi:hypothetical protein BSKO_08241 [Bryopsis sp. KO-2023]|nr:hypothetical protein BSKO_08241 [Bryopsis sp. KO-2023]
MDGGGSPAGNAFEAFRCGGGGGAVRIPAIAPSVEGNAKRTREVQKGEPSQRCKQPKSKAKQIGSSESGDGIVGLPEKLGDSPLRLVIVGHNPSDHAWKSGHYYSNPSNRMWKILKATGIAPESVAGAIDDDKMQSDAGVGFTDVGTGHPGTVSSDFGSSTFVPWREDFFSRMKAHLGRACSEIDCECGKCGCPCIVAFAGKRQFLELFNAGRSPVNRVKSVDIGKQTRLPQGWPFPSETEVWVLPSTSGASALKNEQREGPFREVAAILESIPWPRNVAAKCAKERVEGKETEQVDVKEEV